MTTAVPNNIIGFRLIKMKFIYISKVFKKFHFICRLISQLSSITMDGNENFNSIA
jgi:hypothetical protein